MHFNHDNHPSSHTLQAFDIELEKLHNLLLDMTDVLIGQLELSIHALENADEEYANNAQTLNTELDQYRINIDAEILVILAKFTPVANDLRCIMSISKIVTEIEKMGDEFSRFATLILASINSHSTALVSTPATEVSKMSRHLLALLSKLRSVFETENTDKIKDMLETDKTYETDRQQSIQQQLVNMLKNEHNVIATLEVMQMLKLLEMCEVQCQHIVKHIIFMIDRVDARHHS